MSKNSIDLRPLLPSDIPFGMHLKTQAGWNQVESDWEILLQLSSSGSYLATYQGHAAGTVITIQYDQKINWIGMVLVEPSFRALGIGTSLLQAAIEDARAKGIVFLDATPKGRKLYQTLGFIDVCQLERMEITAMPKFSNISNHDIYALNESNLAACIQYDREQFGAGREKLLQHYYRNAPDYSFIAARDKQIAGYCMVRYGSHFQQIGPLMADDFLLAKALFERVAAHCENKPVIVDAFCSQVEWYDYLSGIGFQVQRPFTRMFLGEGSIQPDRSRQFAIAGPEFG